MSKKSSQKKVLRKKICVTGLEEFLKSVSPKDFDCSVAIIIYTMSESEEEYLTDGSDSEKEKTSDNAPIMSIFASYYGIEDTTQPEPEVMGTIDDSNFDHVTYVKNVLQHESVEGMVAKDSELVHEIRNLDGEMQKLVYDNYNKFITATETIKEMKTDVFSMDSDMLSVRSTMGHIAEASRKLDGVFEEKRGEVDKLVRIRRLLDRLVGKIPYH